MQHLSISERAALFAAVAERTAANPGACLTSWEWLCRVLDDRHVTADLRTPRPGNTDPHQYIAISNKSDETRNAAYLIYGSGRVEILIPHDHVTGFHGHPATRFKNGRGSNDSDQRVYVYLDRTDDAPDVALTLMRRALAHEAARA
ncbi:hypothetical protein MTF65_14010 [Streptomyces sp. APSN-46.1]|uniref:hypothetical protein n=1 Tax=Streptomyces sp. APSN-46.1 TaxID=2929049 RepID=UPI001FB1D20B|nr:hypothetical protein [Streptomyces sp. APSN-46.1]MCJ1678442.1 hypothetical protein [Streptomyces sp. APSN-46.1]